MEEKRTLGRTLGWAAHLARERLDARLAQYDVTPAQTHVLLYLHRREGQAPQRELTEFLKVKPSTANGILDRMVEKGLVVRQVSGKDGRQKLVLLTQRGAEKQALFHQTILEFETMLTGDFTQEERETLRALLHRIIGNLEEDRAE